MRAVILGPPGSGKGTISSLIAVTFDLSHLSSGDLLRAQVSRATPLGLRAQNFITAGRLVPDETMVPLILAELQTMKGAWLLDGFPRTRVQAEALHLQERLDTVISLNVPPEVIVDRVRGRWVHLPSGRVYNEGYNPPRVAGRDDVTGEPLVQRDDDRPETVRERLQQYEEQTHPVLEYYRGCGLLRVFSGTKSDEIWPLVKRYLLEELPSQQQRLS